jgi:RHS repeat-associated protein
MVSRRPVHRYYSSSSLGRFLSPDPYMANASAANDPTEPKSWNRYSYVQNDPVNFKDSTGLIQQVPWEDDPNQNFYINIWGTDPGDPFIPVDTGGDDPLPPPDCDVQLRDATIIGGSAVHSYLYVNIGNGWQVLEGIGDPMPVPGSHLNAYASATGTLVQDHPDTDHVQFDAKKVVGLTPQQICDDANAIFKAEQSYEKNWNGKIHYDPLGIFAANSNSFARYLFTFAPDLSGLVKPSRRAKGWNHKLLGI